MSAPEFVAVGRGRGVAAGSGAAEGEAAGPGVAAGAAEARGRCNGDNHFHRLLGGGGVRCALRALAQLNHDALAIPLLQLPADLFLLLRLPVRIGAVDRDGDGISIGEVSQVDGPLHQLVGRRVPAFALVGIALDQHLPVGVEGLQVQHPLGAADGHLHVRVDLNAHGSVGREIGLIISKEGQTHAGRQSRRSDQRPVAGAALFLGRPQFHHVLHGVAHPVMQVGRLDKASPLVQKHRIGRVCLHHKVLHGCIPPFPGPIWHRWPRIIS